MLPYWLMFLLPSFGAIAGLGRHVEGRRRDLAFLVLLFVVFAALIGLREETGGDFFAYRKMVQVIGYERLSTSFSYGDPGFTLLATLSNALGLGIYGVNFGCGALLLIGLLRFSRRLPDPWLGIAAAVPYMLIVIGMGYIRQGAAIGFIMLAMINLEHRRFGWMAFDLVMAMTFHVTAVCVVPLLGFAILRNRPLFLVPIVLLGVVAYFLILRARFDTLYSGYVTTEIGSSGALIRLSMNALPAILLLALRRRFPIPEPAKSAWLVIALLSLAMIPIVLVFPSSTVIDRIGLFFSPIQLLVFGHITAIFAANEREQRTATFLSLMFYGVVLFVWLNYATFSRWWIPYRWVLSN